MNVPLSSSLARYRSLRHKLLADFPELAEDEETLLDTLDGETDLSEQLAILLRESRTAEAMANGVKELMKQMADRKSRLEGKAVKLRSIVQHIMQDIGLDKLEQPDFTASIRNVPAAVSISDETLIPDQFCRIKKEPDKTKIKSALQSGESVPGAQMGNGGQTLSIRSN